MPQLCIFAQGVQRLRNLARRGLFFDGLAVQILTLKYRAVDLVDENQLLVPHAVGQSCAQPSELCLSTGHSEFWDSILGALVTLKGIFARIRFFMWAILRYS